MRIVLAVFAASILMATHAIAQENEEEPGTSSSPEAEQSVNEGADMAEETIPAEEQPAPKPKPKPKAKPAPKPAPAPAKPKEEKPVEKEAATPLPLSKPVADYVILRVGTQDIPASEVKHMWEGLFPRGAAPNFEELKSDMRDRVLRGVIAERLLWQEALKQGVDKTETIQRDLEEVKRKMVVKALLDSKTTDIGDQELQSAYNDMVLAARDEKEVRARHILVGSEKEAKEVQKSLEAGKSFEEVARDYSKDPGSATQGGDLGYFTKDKMVPEFSDAAFGLKKGEVSTPTKTSFGWHIIKIEDIRAVAPPTFNDAKESLKAKLQEKRLSDYVRTLVKQSEVKLFDAKGAELPFNKDTAQDLGIKP